MVKIFIAGATGELGRQLVQQLAGRGHTVLGLARSPGNEQLIQRLGGIPRPADLFDPDSLAAAAEGAEVVIHAATAIPTKPKPAPADWQLNDRIRREGTAALTQAAAKIGARLYLQQSIVAVIQPENDQPFDEQSPPRPNAITQSALDGEQIAREAGQRHGFNTAVLRCGWFYGPESALVRMMAARIARRQLPLIGPGQAVLPSLHSEDAASAFVTVAEAGRPGLWHVLDNHGATVEAMLTGLARRLGARPPFRIPVWLGRLLLGREGVEVFTRSLRTSNRLFRQDFGWSPRYPSIEEGLDQVVAAWQAEGFLSQAGTGPGHSPVL